MNKLDIKDYVPLKAFGCYKCSKEVLTAYEIKTILLKKIETIWECEGCYEN